MTPSTRPRLGQYALPALIVAITLLVTVDIMLIALRGNLPSNRQYFLVLAAAIVLAIKVLLDGHARRTGTDLDAKFAMVHQKLDSQHRAQNQAMGLVMQRLIDHDMRNSPTEPILRVVGTAAVTAQVIESDDDSGELPGYAKGYVDGLARKPMADSKVIPISGRKS